MPTEVPGTIADRLYAAPPDGFVAARDEEVARARAAGDADLARQIAKLRKPTVAAWLVNLLAIERPELIAGLGELAAQLRAAQRELRGPALRELSEQRRALVSELVGEAVALARNADRRQAAKPPVAEVEATLNAALADAEVAAVVRAGRLVRAVAYAGFGEVPRPQLRLITGGSGAPVAPTRGAQSEPAAEPTVDRAAVRREVIAARAASRDADAALAQSGGAEQEAAQALARLEAELAELERRRSAAEDELTRLKLARKAAERTAVAARRRMGDAEAAAEQAGVDVPAQETADRPGVGINRVRKAGRRDRKSVRGAESGR